MNWPGNTGPVLLYKAAVRRSLERGRPTCHSSRLSVSCHLHHFHQLQMLQVIVNSPIPGPWCLSPSTTCWHWRLCDALQRSWAWNQMDLALPLSYWVTSENFHFFICQRVWLAWLWGLKAICGLCASDRRSRKQAVSVACLHWQPLSSPLWKMTGPLLWSSTCNWFVQYSRCIDTSEKITRNEGVLK